MKRHYTVTEHGIAHSIPLDGPTVFLSTEGEVVIQYWPGSKSLFLPIYPDQSFLEIVRLREQARHQVLPSPN